MFMIRVEKVGEKTSKDEIEEREDDRIMRERGSSREIR